MNNRLRKGEREGGKERKKERRKEGREKERGRGKEGKTTCFVDFLITECLTMVISHYTVFSYQHRSFHELSLAIS